MRKGVKKQFWLTKEEAAELKHKAQCTCLTEVGVIRYLIMGYQPKQKPDERFFEAMRELSAIGNNINQLAAKANSLGVKRSVGTSFRRILRAYFYAPINRI